MNTINSKPHKFIEAAGVGATTYRGVIFCEYCGHVAFNANASDNTQAQAQAKQECPLAPSISQPKEL